MCTINARLPLVASWVPFLERVFFCNMWVQHTTYVAGCNIPHVDHAGTRGGVGVAQHGSTLWAHIKQQLLDALNAHCNDPYSFRMRFTFHFVKWATLALDDNSFARLPLVAVPLPFVPGDEPFN